MGFTGTTLMNNTDTTNRGTKRTADDALDDEQRFAKRFNLLNLRTYNKAQSQTRPILTLPTGDRDGSKLYIPVAAKPQPRSSLSGLSANDNPEEHMQLDDTKDRVYIHDLEEELADIESDEEKLIFLPDIEKQLSRIPQHILTGRKPDAEEHQELVLYSVPTSLTVPAEEDSVRKAIIEARQRARDKSACRMESAAQQRNMHEQNEPETAHGFGEEEYSVQEADDPDAMDVG